MSHRSPALERAMREANWKDAGQGWEGKETALRLMGWSRQRRIIMLRRKLRGDLAIAETTQAGQPRLSFAEIDGSGEVWEYAALVTSLSDEILTLGQLYRDRADCEIYQTWGLSRISFGVGCLTSHRGDRRWEPSPWGQRDANRSELLDGRRIGMHQNELIPSNTNRSAA